MADTITKAERSALMARLRGTNTKPEVFVRRLARADRVGVLAAHEGAPRAGGGRACPPDHRAAIGRESLTSASFI